MSRPQQRRVRNARLTDANTPAIVPDVIWIPGTGTPPQVLLTLQSPPSGCILNGIPQVKLLPANAYPIGATLDGVNLTLTYAEPVALNSTALIPSRDPAFRTPAGGYLAGGVAQLLSSIPPTVTITGPTAICAVGLNLGVTGGVGGEVFLPGGALGDIVVFAPIDPLAGDWTIAGNVVIAGQAAIAQKSPAGWTVTVLP